MRDKIADSPVEEESKRQVEVDFRELADGTLLEMIENPHDATKSFLATWKKGRIQYVPKLKCRNQVFVPIPRGTEIVRHLHLANGAESYDSLKILLGDISVVLASTLELSIIQILVLASFVVSTWFIDKLPVAPYVAFVGPAGSGKTTALRVLNLLCRRSLLTSDISSSAFYEVCDRMTPTLLIDEMATTDNRRQLAHLLRAGTTPDFVTVRKGNTYRSFGARAFSWTGLPDDEALNSRCVIIPMTSCKNTRLLPLKDPKVLRLAEKIQRQLLHFRLNNYKTLTPPEISDQVALQPRTMDLFRALALPLSSERSYCEVISSFLKNQESLRELLSVHQSSVLDSLYNLIHADAASDHVRVSTLKEYVNANLLESGELGNLSEKRVGDLLTSLQLTKRKRTNSGYILWLDRETRKQIHSLANKYTTNGLPLMSEQCDLCQALNQQSANDSAINPSKHAAGPKANDRSELGELGERAKRGVSQKPTQARMARPRVSRPIKPAIPKRQRYFIRPKAANKLP